MIETLLSAAGMVAPSIIQPLSPKGEGWLQQPDINNGSGYPIKVYGYFMPKTNLVLREMVLCVLSAVEVVEPEPGEQSKGPEYHISVSKQTMNGGRYRCSTNEANWILKQFGLEGAEEDNHVPGGFVRNFWRPVADPLVGMECVCKDDEPAIREDKGDFVWRPTK